MLQFSSRRSPLYGTHGMVCSSQPLASEVGMRILKAGGNAADAAVAVAAALNVTEPCSTGIGGDAFCLFFDAKTKTVKGLNGSGRAPAAMTLEIARRARIDGDGCHSIHAVTVPGAASAWVDTVKEFGGGKLTLAEILQPAITLAEEGFPLHPIAANSWNDGSWLLRQEPNISDGHKLLPNGRAPRAGELMRNPDLANTFRLVGERGKAGFYEGPVAAAIIELSKALGGVMTAEDLMAHRTTFDEPIHVNYHGVDVYEIPPSGQGITALIGLNILDDVPLASMGHNSPTYLHHVCEAMRLAFADTRRYVADPAVTRVPTAELLSKRYAAERRAQIKAEKATVDVKSGSPLASTDTVYFCVVDGEGNACSFIISNYMGFGTGLVPRGCGFTLQNRGANFSLEDGHPNIIEPNKRPYHTIIPGMAVKDGELYCAFGVMGGFMQPSGHVQVLVNMIDYGMDPQQALDAPRFCIGDGTAGGVISFEEGIPEATIEELRRMGHKVAGPVSGFARALFGRGQIIRRNPANGVLCAGSDPRADGCAMGW